MYKEPLLPPALPKAATPLERAIHEFEVRCDAHFSATQSQNVAGETAQEKQERLRKWNEARDHLEAERRRINTLAQMEEQLDLYRKDMGISTSSDIIRKMLAEKHHPTSTLAKNLITTGEAMPSLRHTAHHIVPGSGRWRKREMLNVRTRLHMSGVRINDPLNGVWLPRAKQDANHWATPTHPDHKSIHGDNYEKWIAAQLGAVGPGAAFLGKLAVLKAGIKDGTFPVKIVEPKDEQWDGNTI